MSTAGPDSLLEETLLGRYRIDQTLGHGGMGAVYRAFDIRLGRTVVVKVPRADVLVDPRLRTRFLAEVRDLSAHEHPNILGIQDFGEHEGVPFAVLQHLGGGDLGERLGDTPQSPLQVLAWLPAIASALDFVHEKGCLHRDVKPSNILFDEMGHAFLADFGIATVLEDREQEDGPTSPRHGLTATGGIVGSGAYSPPEAVDRLFSPAFDQYSLATVVYLALCADLPFDGATAEALLIAKYQDAPLPLEDRCAEVEIEPGVAAVVTRALARNPGERFESCTAFARAFEAALASSETGPGDESVVHEDGGSPAEPSSDRRSAFLWGALVVVAAIAGWALWPGGEARVEGFPVRAELGSRPAEIAQAMQLCLEFGGICTPEDFSGEDPRVVWLVEGQLDPTEVTFADFATWIDSTGRQTRAERAGESFEGPLPVKGLDFRSPFRGSPPLASHPVVHVSVDEARAFCVDRGSRLPSADEWEYAARGPARRVFPWGDTWDATRLDSAHDGSIGPSPVGRHPNGETPEGVKDLAGNVWEWTSTRSREGWVIKGGSWDDDVPTYFRGAAFAVVDGQYTSSDVGFRCFTPTEPSSPDR